MATAYNPRLATSGLIAYFDPANTASYGGSGSSLNNLAGSGNSLTLYGSPAFSSNNLGYFTFNSASSNYGENASPTGLSGNAEATLAAWVYPTSTTGFIESVISYGGGPAAGDSLAISLFTSNRSWSLAFNGGNDMATAGGSYTLNAWNYLVATKTPGAANTTTKLYVNGSEVTVATTTTITPNVVSRVLRLGRWPLDSQPLYLNGRISCAMIYNRALSASEIASNFSALRGRYGI
jgi:hypothetical protein